MEALDHGVVVGRAGRDAHVGEPLGRQRGAEGAGVVLRTVVAEHGPDLAGLLGQCQHGEAPTVDDLCVGHGDGLLGSVEGTTESIAGPLKGVDVQPQHLGQEGLALIFRNPFNFQ